MPRTALIAGATGFLGQQLIKRLITNPNYGAARALSRREPGRDPRIEWLRSDFSDLDMFGDRLGVDDVFCCLGTTLAKCDGSYEERERIEYGMVIDLARACRAAGAKRFYAVSSLFASRFSPFHHLRVKARTERALARIGFEGVGIIRPSLFLGAREDDFRFWEDFLQQTVTPLISPLLIGPLQPLRPRQIDFVAEMIMHVAMLQEGGVNVHYVPLRKTVVALAKIAAGPPTSPKYDDEPPPPVYTKAENLARLEQGNAARLKATASLTSNVTAPGPQAWGDSSREGPYAVHDPGAQANTGKPASTETPTP
jgi:uncharacterized protein YbjT (DUF2867 family)